MSWQNFQKHSLFPHHIMFLNFHENIRANTIVTVQASIKAFFVLMNIFGKYLPKINESEVRKARFNSAAFPSQVSDENVLPLPRVQSLP